PSSSQRPGRHGRARRGAGALALAMALVAAGCGGSGTGTEPPPENPQSPPAVPVAVKAVPQVTGLARPWSFAFLPDGRILVTERDGTLRIVANGSVSAPLAGVPAVSSSGQGGLLDVVLGPTFETDKRIYFTFSEPEAGGLARTAVARATLGDDAISDLQVIYRQMPAAASGNHFGSRLVFDRQGYLFVTLGERFEPDQAQRVQVSLGKIVRILPDGSIPQDNPAAVPGSVDTGRPGDADPAHPSFLEPGAL